MQRFRGGLVFKAQRLLYLSTQSNKEEEESYNAGVRTGLGRFPINKNNGGIDWAGCFLRMVVYLVIYDSG